ncbi:MAG TPA: response regulator transcription factor [Pirellulales bacterium]|jgi:DNA-binding NarL/FixJ family response regulator|nr:response regulator transcription factor [Pirellulales bacterium]
MAIKLLVADDQEVVRTGLVSLLSGTDIKIVAEAKNGTEAVKLAVKHKPDVVLLDIRMTDTDGLEALEKIHKQLPNTKVVVLSVYDNPTYVARAHALGASDYVLKGCSKAELVNAITSAVQGSGPIRTGEMRRVAYAMSSAADQKHEDLPITPREMQVLRHIALGLSNKEIARSLEISVETVKEHVQNLLRKLGVSDRTQAAVLAVRKGVV